jgi:hypothetical protein
MTWPIAAAPSDTRSALISLFAWDAGLAIALTVAGVSILLERRRARAQFLWRTVSIQASIQRADNIVFGQYLNLDQQLRHGEGGWTNMKIDVPDYWRVGTVLVDHDRVRLTLEDGSRYSVGRDNIGKLTFEVLDGGPGKSDEILEKIWNQHALERTG